MDTTAKHASLPTSNLLIPRDSDRSCVCLAWSLSHLATLRLAMVALQLSSLSARAASPAPDRPTTPPHQVHAPQSLNNELAAAAAGHARSVSYNDPSTSASTSAPVQRTGFSLPSRSTSSPYREYQVLQQNGVPRHSTSTSVSRARTSARFSSDGSASASASASPRSHGAELPPLASPLASSPSSVNSPLPETPSSEVGSSTPFGSISGLALDRSNSMSGSMRKRISALIGGIAGSGGKKRPALDISTPQRPVDARVQMLTSATTPTLRDAVAAAGSGVRRTGSPGGDHTPSRGSSNASSTQRKGTPGSTMSKASTSGRPAFGDPSDSGRRGISRPMDASASSAGSHHSTAPRTSVDAHGVIEKRGSVDAARRSQLSNRGRGFEHGSFAFEKPLTRVAPPLGSSLTPSRQPLKQGSTDTGASVARTIDESVNEGQFGSTGSRARARVSLDDSPRSRANSGGRSVSEKADHAALGRAASVGHAKLNDKEKVLGEKKRSGSMREKRAPVREEPRKEKTSSLGRMFLNKTREVFCAGRPRSQLSHISPPISPMVVQARRSPTAPTSPTTITPAVSTSVQPNQSGPALPPRKRKPLPISTQLPLFAFEPASSAGRSTPDSARSRGAGSTPNARDREVSFKMPGGAQHARERVAAMSSRSPKTDGPAMPDNSYDLFCMELRRVVGDDAFVVFEKCEWPLLSCERCNLTLTPGRQTFVSTKTKSSRCLVPAVLLKGSRRYWISHTLAKNENVHSSIASCTSLAKQRQIGDSDT